jgi:hypothetical protein
MLKESILTIILVGTLSVAVLGQQSAPASTLGGTNRYSCTHIAKENVVIFGLRKLKFSFGIPSRCRIEIGKI